MIGTNSSTRITWAAKMVASPLSNFTRNTPESIQLLKWPASQSATRVQKMKASRPQPSTATRIGQIISQSMRGCSRLTKATATAAKMRLMKASQSSFADTLPQLGQALGRDRHRGAQFLREQRNPQLLEQPAELIQLSRSNGGRAALRLARLSAAPGLLQRRDFGRTLRVARRIRAQLVQAQRSGLQVAREMLQALPGGAREETGPQQLCALLLHVLGRLRPGLLHGRQALLHLRLLGQDRRREALHLLRDEVEAVAALLHAARELRLQ